jgi:hypothetical protein
VRKGLSKLVAGGKTFNQTKVAHLISLGTLANLPSVIRFELNAPFAIRYIHASGILLLIFYHVTHRHTLMMIIMGEDVDNG